MKKLNNYYAILLTALAISCSEEKISEEFNQVNGNVPEKLIETIRINSAQNNEQNEFISLVYTLDRKLSTISRDNSTTIFIYDDENDLVNISGDGEVLNIEELYQSPYNAFETGDVIQYDDHGNPEKIEFFETIFDFNSGSYITRVYTAEITYDQVHNPYYYTLKSAGIIDVLDGVQLNFNMNPQIPEIVQAKLLFPLNNPSQINYRNEEGAIIWTINVNHDYDDQNYPVSATVVSNSVADNTQEVYSIFFQYLE